MKQVMMVVGANSLLHAQTCNALLKADMTDTDDMITKSNYHKEAVERYDELSNFIITSGFGHKIKKQPAPKVLEVPDQATIAAKGLLPFVIEGQTVWAKTEANAILNFSKTK